MKRDKKGNPNYQCVKENNVCVIQNKFPGYLEAAYKNGASHYSDYYTTKTVYRAGTNDTRNYNNLIIENSEYYYVKNETKWKFPSHSNDTLREMGLEECMVVAATVGKKNVSFLLKYFTNNASRNVELVELWGRTKLKDLTLQQNYRRNRTTEQHLDAIFFFFNSTAGYNGSGNICHNTFSFPAFQSLHVRTR